MHDVNDKTNEIKIGTKPNVGKKKIKISEWINKLDAIKWVSFEINCWNRKTAVGDTYTVRSRTHKSRYSRQLAHTNRFFTIKHTHLYNCTYMSLSRSCRLNVLVVCFAFIRFLSSCLSQVRLPSSLFSLAFLRLTQVYSLPVHPTSFSLSSPIKIPNIYFR